jgi:hypothetical protein
MPWGQRIRWQWKDYVLPRWGSSPFNAHLLTSLLLRYSCVQQRAIFHDSWFGRDMFVLQGIYICTEEEDPSFVDALLDFVDVMWKTPLVSDFVTLIVGLGVSHTTVFAKRQRSGQKVTLCWGLLIDFLRYFRTFVWRWLSPKTVLYSSAFFLLSFLYYFFVIVMYILFIYIVIFCNQCTPLVTFLIAELKYCK